MDPNVALLLIKVLDGVLFAIQHAPRLIDRWRGHLGLVKLMIAENRGPTEAEQLTVDADYDRLSNRLQAIVDADERVRPAS